MRIWAHSYRPKRAFGSYGRGLLGLLGLLSGVLGDGVEDAVDQAVGEGAVDRQAREQHPVIDRAVDQVDGEVEPAKATRRPHRRSPKAGSPVPRLSARGLNPSPCCLLQGSWRASSRSGTS